MGRPSPAVDWYKASTKMSNNGRVEISNFLVASPSPVTGLYRVTSLLTIFRAVREDIAWYDCVASTTKSVPTKSATARVNLIVQGENIMRSVYDSFLRQHYRARN